VCCQRDRPWRGALANRLIWPWACFIEALQR
jgi:hypothetical protein